MTISGVLLCPFYKEIINLISSDIRKEILNLFPNNAKKSNRMHKTDEEITETDENCDLSCSYFFEINEARLEATLGIMVHFPDESNVQSRSILSAKYPTELNIDGYSSSNNNNDWFKCLYEASGIREPQNPNLLSDVKNKGLLFHKKFSVQKHEKYMLIQNKQEIDKLNSIKVNYKEGEKLKIKKFNIFHKEELTKNNTRSFLNSISK